MVERPAATRAPFKRETTIVPQTLKQTQDFFLLYGPGFLTVSSFVGSV